MSIFFSRNLYLTFFFFLPFINFFKYKFTILNFIDKLKSDIEEVARKNAEEISEKANNQIKAEKEKALGEIQDIAVELTMEIAEKVIKRNINNEDNKKFIDETVNHLGQA